jgi:hypothetical protein
VDPVSIAKDRLKKTGSQKDAEVVISEIFKKARLRATKE